MLTDIRALLKLHHSESYIWALRCCLGDQDEGKEVLQESYLKVLEGKAMFNGQSEFKTWLFAVIRITAADLRRKRFIREIKNVELHKLLNHFITKTDNPIQTGIESNNEQLAKALKELSPKQQQVLRLVFYHDFTIEKAAIIMGITIGSARTHYERGKNNLRVKIKL
jgi:RNA polymerase sigma-70 factor, ECF subfamily